MAYLSGVRVGDELWSIQLGKCVVKEVRVNSIEAVGDSGCACFYGFDGRYFEQDQMPSLFWSEPKCEVPPKPKRKVKKLLWVNVYPKYELRWYPSKEFADNDAFLGRIACVPLEFEEEEE